MMQDILRRIEALEARLSALEGRSETQDMFAAQEGRPQYTPEFEAFWKAYPTDRNMSKKTAFQEWKKLPKAKQERAKAAAPQFMDYCKANPDYRAVHACRFLKEERFEGFQPQYDGADFCVVKRGTPQWDAWANHRRSKGIRFNPESMTVPSEYPPIAKEKEPV